ncbi:Aldo/keto reductase [Mytilinidion resinicola]|uniref:Aldo/keto reductase n=1 Tax=Mytilinidion resinicola TaxID=574789 RepID=A0A6A6Y889_9PEZI|nr:Aldo/keto reductase [Mytilinidion resinicola]KAF2804768.1 Aldo/keto reductase [Mytilinidion resinicola]
MKTVQLVGKEVGQVGYGLMGLTWRPSPPSQAQSFKAMRAALAHGANFWNGGEIYGSPERNSLHLLSEYFTQYPDDADKVVLSIKGALLPGQMVPDSSAKNIKRSIDECLRFLDGKKSLDLFECARLDGKTDIEDVVATIGEYVKAGKVGGISLSEVSAKTIRRAAKVQKIAAVEVEFSLWATDLLENGVAEACKEHDIPIIAYSPLGRGFLTGQYKSFDDLPADSMLRSYPRFQPDVFDENLKLVREVETIAKQKSVTPAQIAISWILAKSGQDGYPVIIPIPGATTEERINENMNPIPLTKKDVAAIDDALKRVTVKGNRYPDAGMHHVDM